MTGPVRAVLIVQDEQGVFTAYAVIPAGTMEGMPVYQVTSGPQCPALAQTEAAMQRVLDWKDRWAGAKEKGVQL